MHTSFFRALFLDAAAFALGAFLVLGPCLPSAAQSAPSEPPIQIPAAAGKSVILVQALGTGTQIYTCKKTAEGYAWVLKAPDAALLGSDGSKIGRHYAGPTWEASDGSKVVGKVLASAKSPGNVPWLLLSASPKGKGRFAKVTYVERVHTSGGVAPKTGADAAHLGNEVRVPYTATYIFYGSQ